MSKLKNFQKTFTQTKKQHNEKLSLLGQQHIQSFSEMIDTGLKNAAHNMTPLYLVTPSGDRVIIKVSSIRIFNPVIPLDAVGVKERKIFPDECRQRGSTYKGVCSVSLGWEVNGLQKSPISADLGEVPIMVKSQVCNLHGMTPEQLIKCGEHESEWGGYFIIKGNEKIIRMLLMTRRNYPIAIKRSVWKRRGLLFSDLGIIVRTVRNDEVSFNNVLHYLTNGTAKFMFSNSKILSYIPVYLLLRSLTNKTDDEIMRDLTGAFINDQYYLQCLQNMAREIHEEGLHTQTECKNYIGELFRRQFADVKPWARNEEVCDYILNERILIHIGKHDDKYNFLVLMIQKLFQCAQGKNEVENADSVMMQEVLLGGHLYQKVLIERIEIWLRFLKKLLLKKIGESSAGLTPALLSSSILQNGNIGKSLESFLATGNISSISGLGLMQSTGLVVIAENINRMRYMSHFRAVHRGSYFTTMRTTEARQLLPDAWGFICPVHTPDGAPCGLLNHLSSSCQISNNVEEKNLLKISDALIELGLIPCGFQNPCYGETETTVVLLEGRILGYIKNSDATNIISSLKHLKVNGTLPYMMEIAFVPKLNKGQFPGLFIFTGPSRMMRPVKNMHLNKIEFIGTFEQTYLNISVESKMTVSRQCDYSELSKTSFLSYLANLIPMPDCNQSPRNMYQCQMSKQTMGTPCHNFGSKSETKLYRLQTPATPLFRPTYFDELDLHDFASGTNAIVAVVSYTGYDMEDAMIINKAANERGFAYGCIYKSQFVELESNNYFARNPLDTDLAIYIDTDGLPAPGSKLKYKCPLYSYFDPDASVYKVVKNDEKEDCIVDSVKCCGDFKLHAPRKICITLRIPRPANIGDKFASRAGQKGIYSYKYPAEDLPFNASGLIPDIVFNPHGFPSRMTIAMMVEAMAGKSASVNGLAHDASPFKFTEKSAAIDYFGQILQDGGYNFYGTERMYSGIDGSEMVADIFCGVVHYQRLRHMVFDKWQVRSTGPNDAITQQPIKGRKRGGGVRFGEMERDALISHGAAFLLQDRLFYNSDKSLIIVCQVCGTFTGPSQRIVRKTAEGLMAIPALCKLCEGNYKLGLTEIPFSYKYFVTELASVNLNARFKISLI